MPDGQINVVFPQPFPPIDHIYANVVLVNRVKEIVIDFGYIDPFNAAKTPKGKPVQVAHLTRLVMTPKTANELLEKLQNVLEKKSEKNRKDG